MDVSDDDDESGEDVEESGSDSEDEEDATTTTLTMPTKTKGSTPSKKPAAAAAPLKSKKSDPDHVDGELQTLIKRYEKLGISEDKRTGYNFTGKFPYFWFKFTHNSIAFIQIEMLLPTTHHTELSCQISSDGMRVFVNGKLPSSLLDPRIWQARHNIPDADLGDHLLYQAGLAATTYVKDVIDDDEIQPFMEIPLPVQCQTVFCDPYRNANDPGIYFNYYPHPLYPRRPRPQDIANAGEELLRYIEHLENNAHRVCIASMTLKSAVLPKTPRGVEAQPNAINW